MVIRVYTLRKTRVLGVCSTFAESSSLESDTHAKFLGVGCLIRLVDGLIVALELTTQGSSRGHIIDVSKRNKHVYLNWLFGLRSRRCALVYASRRLH